MKFRKKPVVVDAMQWNGKNTQEIADFVGESLAPIARHMDYKIFIRTLESGQGYHEADRGDWIIKGVNGEFYPCKPDIFEKTYEPATD